MMRFEFFSIFINIVTPVFALVIIGYWAGPRLNLEARTLSRTAYYVFIPAFVFDTLVKIHLETSSAARMVAYILIVHLACAVLGFLTAKLLRRPREVVAAFTLIAVFGNIGNFGLSIIEFGLGKEALAAGTIYFVAINTLAFAIGVAAASWAKGSGFGAIGSVVKTPGLIAMAAALAVQGMRLQLPLSVLRITGLLGQAMIPLMLVTLGVQLAAVKKFHITGDVIIVSAIRLLGGPVLAALLVIPFGLTGIERGAGILQAAMPAAVLTSIIAIEYDVVPDFVTTSVLFSTLASLLTLTVVLWMM